MEQGRRLRHHAQTSYVFGDFKMSSPISKLFTVSMLALALCACGKSSDEAPSSTQAAAKVETKHVVFGGKFAVDVPSDLVRQGETDAMVALQNKDGAVLLVATEAEDASASLSSLTKQTEENLKQKYSDLAIVGTGEIKVGDITLQKIEATMTAPQTGPGYTYMAVGLVDGHVIALTVVGSKDAKDALSATGENIAKSLTKV